MGEKKPLEQTPANLLNTTVRKTLDIPAPSDVFDTGGSDDGDPVFQPPLTGDDESDFERIPRIPVDYDEPISPELLALAAQENPDEVEDEPIRQFLRATGGEVGFRDPKKKE